MPGDPKECRQHAANCRCLAETASTVAARQSLLNLADTWERLASELESARLFLKAMEAIEPRIPPNPSALNGPERGATDA
jgi:hypothetical protein